MDTAEIAFVSLLLLTILSCPFLARTEICYRCASEFIVMYWTHLLPIQTNDELVADKSCIKVSERSEEVRCSGPCLTLNVTIGEGNNSRIIGMMRDCQKKYYRRESVNERGGRNCRNRTIRVRQRVLNAQYCFCLGSYCNGDQLVRSPGAFRKATKSTIIQDHQENGSSILQFFSCYIQTLVLVCIVCFGSH